MAWCLALLCAIRREELLSFCLGLDLTPLGKSQKGWHRLIDCAGHWRNEEIGFVHSLEHEMGFGLELVGCLQLDTVVGMGTVLHCLCGRSDLGFVFVRYSAEVEEEEGRVGRVLYGSHSI